jgi:RNA polymerase sigma factor (sigma-70 family)
VVSILIPDHRDISRQGPLRRFAYEGIYMPLRDPGRKAGVFFIVIPPHETEPNKSGFSGVIGNGKSISFRSMRSDLMRLPSDHADQKLHAVLRLLTDREQQIVSLVCTGMGNKTIAHRLGVTEGTVKSHLNKIYRKLGIRNRTALIISIANDTKA